MLAIWGGSKGGSAIVVPVVNAAPSITNTTGGTWSGSLLTATPATWTGTVISVAGQWYRGASAITGATGITYVRQQSDIGQGVITYKEIATGPGGNSLPATSNTLAAGISGIIFAFGVRDTAGFVADTLYWSNLITGNTTFVGKHPSNGAGGTDPNTTYTGKLSGTPADANNSLPAMLAGRMTLGLGASCVVGQVPTATNVLVRCAAGSDGSTTTQQWLLTSDDWTVSAGTNVKATVNSTSVTSTQLANIGSAGSAGGAVAEVISSYSSWESTATWFPVTTTATGALSIGRNSVTNCQIRAFECIYPEYNINYQTSGLPSNTAYSDIVSGNDSTGNGATATPFANIVGTLGAGGIVPAFTISPDGFNKVRSGTYRPPAASAPVLISTNSLGTSGHPVTITADTGATVLIDGSTLVTGWAAVTSSNTGGAWENPNHANLVIKTGLTGPQLPFTDGEAWCYPAQFPNPSNPADYQLTYPGNDGFVALTNVQYAAQVVYDATTQYNAAGVPTGGGTYRKIAYTSPDVQTQYSGSSINISGVAQGVVMITGNRLLELTVRNHVPATGYFEVYIDASSVTPFVPAGGQIAYFAIRYHPFDVRKAGQYSYDASGNGVVQFATATRGCLNSAFNYAYRPANDYNTLSGVTLRRTGYLGAAISDAVGGVGRAGFVISDVKIRQCIVDPNSTRLVRIKANSPQTSGTITNIDIDDCQSAGGIEQEASVNINGIRARSMDGTVLTAQSVPTTPVTYRNLDICDASGIHANCVAAYQLCANSTFTQMLNLNFGIPFSTQANVGAGYAPVRSNTFKNGWFLGKRGYAGNASITIYTWQFGDGELNLSAEGLLCTGVTFYGPSSGGVQPSTSSVIKNCVFMTLVGLDFTGITFQDCYFLRETTPGNSINSIGDITTKNGADGGGNVFAASSGTAYTGTITAAMANALTINHGLGTYTQRNIGNDTTAFGNTGIACVVPAGGANTFPLAATQISTSTISKNFRAGLDFGVLISGEPDCAYSLPVGQGNNSLFQLNTPASVSGSGCYVNLIAGGGGSATTLSLVVDKTCTNPNVTGTNPLRTTITINVV